MLVLCGVMVYFSSPFGAPALLALMRGNGARAGPKIHHPPKLNLSPSHPAPNKSQKPADSGRGDDPGAGFQKGISQWGRIEACHLSQFISPSPTSRGRGHDLKEKLAPGMVVNVQNQPTGVLINCSLLSRAVCMGWGTGE